jgi:hypothetical protein
LYFLLSLILLSLELVVPLLITIFILPISYFVHVYGFVRHRKHNTNVRSYLQLITEQQQQQQTGLLNNYLPQ